MVLAGLAVGVGFLGILLATDLQEKLWAVWILNPDGHGLAALSGCEFGRVTLDNEEIEIALPWSSFSSRRHQLRRALVLPLSIELT